MSTYEQSGFDPSDSTFGIYVHHKSKSKKMSNFIFSIKSRIVCDTPGYSGYMFCIYVNDLKIKHTIPIFDVNLRNDNEVREAFVTKLPANPPVIHSLKKSPCWTCSMRNWPK